MKKATAKRAASGAYADPLSQFEGTSETIAASVPSALAAAIRKRVGKREFSAFVGRALAHELVDQNRAAYVESFVKDHGPIDAELNARLESLFSR